MTSDIVGEVLGPWGAWQRRSVFLIYLCKVPSAWFMACIIFTAPMPRDGEFLCRPLDDNFTLYEAADTRMHIETDYCSLYDDNNGMGIPCESFEHITTFTSLVTQFDLVCAKTTLVAVTQFFHLLGVLTGGILATKLLLM